MGVAEPEEDCREGIEDLLEGAAVAYGVWVPQKDKGTCPGDVSASGNGQGCLDEEDRHDHGNGEWLGKREVEQLSEAGGDKVAGVLLRRSGVPAEMRRMSSKVTASNPCRTRCRRRSGDGESDVVVGGGTTGNSVVGGGGGGRQGEEGCPDRGDRE